ncbi:MAG TPA: amidase [Candidatus Polarisedimenticolaceae bacterium]|nr:amidase [Candidatus Polarisedimenticolaceae bacterium]
MSGKMRSAGAVLAGALMLAACQGKTSNAPESTETPEPRASFPLEEMSIEAMQDAMAKGTLTSRAITEQYLARIEGLDRKGPALRSVIETNPDALAIADALDEERKEKGARGPLHGIPVLIKDNIDTADKMMTTAGSLALVGPAPAQDAFIVERLRAAGAVVLGKTNLSEWANFRSTRSVSGWSGRGGLVRNPYALDRSACGSSSGTGAAIAANFAAVGVGTETDGSIICPSSTNGLVGIKPTVGLASRSGIVPISHTQDTPGPMARTVRDAALLLAAMAGPDPRDQATSAGEGKVPADLVAGLDAGALRGKRIGILRGPFAGYSPKSDLVLDAAVAKLKSLGAEVLDPVELPHAGKYDGAEFEVLQYEFKADLNAYLAGRPGLPVKTLADLIAYNDKNADKEMPHFGQELFLECEKKGPLTEAAYRDALAKARKLSREGIDQALKSKNLDALLALSGGPAWTVDLVNGDHFLGSSTSPAAVSGYPSITVPAGEVAGLPVGISLIGTAWSEPTLIQLAYAFEQATKARKVPSLE